MVRLILQRAFDVATNGCMAPCPVCLGPSARGRGVLLLEGDGPVPQCPACEGAVDLEGRSVGTLQDGELRLKVIRLCERPSLPEPLGDPTPP